ncbi:MAG: hypothetical protein ABI843_02215 [Dokdonella sp.]
MRLRIDLPSLICDRAWLPLPPAACRSARTIGAIVTDIKISVTISLKPICGGAAASVPGKLEETLEAWKTPVGGDGKMHKVATA